MCAGSDAVVRGEKVELYMGHFGSWILVGDLKYHVNRDIPSREDLIAKLSTFTKKELCILIADLVDNSCE